MLFWHIRGTLWGYPKNILDNALSILFVIQKANIPELQEELGKREFKETEPLMHRRCPACKQGNLVTIATFPNREPPRGLLEKIKKQLNRPL